MSNKITLEEFARRIDHSARQVQRWIKAGKLEPRRTPGGRVFFLDEDVKEFFNGGKKRVRSRA